MDRPDQRSILLTPTRPTKGQGYWLSVLASPCLLTIAAFVPGPSDSIRWALVIAAVVPFWAIGLATATAAPIPGLWWLYKNESLMVGTEGLRLHQGRRLVWAIMWADAAELSASATSEQLEIRDREGTRYRLPESLNVAKIDGTTNLVSMTDLLASRIRVVN